MEIEFFDKEKHDYFLNEYRKYSREPSEEEKELFKPLIKEIVGDIAEVAGISTDFKLYFAMTDEETLDDDLPINRYVHAFSYPEWMEGVKTDFILVRTIRGRENWRDCLVNMLAHEMAHQEFYSKNQSAAYTNLENIIFEGHAMNRAEQVAEELNIDWKPHYRSDDVPDVDAEAVIQVLDENRDYEPENIFQNGEDPCPEAEGYQIAYLVVKNLIDEKDFGIESLPEKKADELRSEVVDVLREILD